MNHCDECGFTYDDVAVGDLPGRVLGDVAPYRAVVLGASDAPLRRRPAEGVWSALEYVCHLRDVLVVQRERLERVLAEERPELPSMGPDQRAVDDAYNEQDPAVVLDELDAAAEAFAATLTSLDGDEWQRTGIYAVAGMGERDAAWIGRHTLHEVVHHLRDVRRGPAGGA